MFYAASHTTCSSIDAFTISFLSSAKYNSECYMTLLKISEITTVVYLKHEIYQFLTSSPLGCKICWDKNFIWQLTVQSIPSLCFTYFSLFLNIIVYIYWIHYSSFNVAFSPYHDSGMSGMTPNIINSNDWSRFHPQSRICVLHLDLKVLFSWNFMNYLNVVHLSYST